MEAEETNGSLSGDPDVEPEVGSSKQEFVSEAAPAEVALTTETELNVTNVVVKEREALDDPEAEQSRQSTSSCCSSPPAALFSTASPNRPREMQPRNIVPPLSPNPSDELGSPGPQTGSTGNSSFMLTQSHSMPQQSQFQPYAMPGQMQPQMLQMLQIQQNNSGGMLMPPQLTPNGTPVDAYSDDRFLKRRKRCGECGPCKVNKNCDQCKNCLNRKVLKQTCIYRKCIYLRKKEQGGDGDILDYPSPVPPSTSTDAAGFLPRPAGGQISPTSGGGGGASSNTQQPLQQQQQQTSSQQQQTQSQQQQPQPPSQPILQMQPLQQSGSVVNGGTNLPPGQQSQPPAFLAHGQGFPMQYGGVMSNGYVPGGPIMQNPNVAATQQQQQQQQQPPQLPPSGYMQQQQQLMNPTQQQQQSRQFVPQIPPQQQQQQAQMAPSSSTVVVNTLQQPPPPNQLPSQPVIAQAPNQQLQYKNTRQVLQSSQSDGGDLGKIQPGKPFGNGQSANPVPGNDSLSAILQQQPRLGNVPTNNGYGPATQMSSSTSQPQPMNRGGMMFTSAASNSSNSTNLGNANNSALMNGSGLFSHQNAPGLQMMPPPQSQDQLHAHQPPYSYNMDPSSNSILQQQHQIQQHQQQQQQDYLGYPGGSDNPFCHLKICGGTGHDQKFLSLISYNDCFLDPHLAYSHYYHQIPQNNYLSTASNNNNNSLSSSSSNSLQMQPHQHLIQTHHMMSPQHQGGQIGQPQQHQELLYSPTTMSMYQLPGAPNNVMAAHSSGNNPHLQASSQPSSYHHTANSQVA